MIHESRKLKRGLNDISNLFKSAQTTQTSLPQNAAQHETASASIVRGDLSFYSIYEPTNPKDSVFYSGVFASMFASKEHLCTLVSVGKEAAANQSFGNYYKRTRLKWDGESALRLDSNQGEEAESVMRCNESFFFDFQETISEIHLPIIRLMDQWVFILKPQTESLVECYRIMKWLRSLSLSTRFGIVFEGNASDPKGEMLYEKFSLLVSKHLGLQLNWWGAMELPRDGRKPCFQMKSPFVNPEDLGSENKIKKMEKHHFYQWMKENEMSSSKELL